MGGKLAHPQILTFQGREDFFIGDITSQLGVRMCVYMLHSCVYLYVCTYGHFDFYALSVSRLKLLNQFGLTC